MVVISEITLAPSSFRETETDATKHGHNYHALCSDFPILYPLPEILQVLPTDVMQGDDRLTPKVTTKGDGGWRLPVK